MAQRCWRRISFILAGVTDVKHLRSKVRDEAVKLLLAENNALFQSLTKNLNNYPVLKASIRSILMEGTKLTWKY